MKRKNMISRVSMLLNANVVFNKNPLGIQRNRKVYFIQRNKNDQ